MKNHVSLDDALNALRATAVNIEKIVSAKPFAPARVHCIAQREVCEQLFGVQLQDRPEGDNSADPFLKEHGKDSYAIIIGRPKVPQSLEAFVPYISGTFSRYNKI